MQQWRLHGGGGLESIAQANQAFDLPSDGRAWDDACITQAKRIRRCARSKRASLARIAFGADEVERLVRNEQANT